MEKYSTEAQKIISISENLAFNFGHSLVSSDHLLLSLYHWSSGVIASFPRTVAQYITNEVDRQGNNVKRSTHHQPAMLRKPFLFLPMDIHSSAHVRQRKPARDTDARTDTCQAMAFSRCDNQRNHQHRLLVQPVHVATEKRNPPESGISGR